MVLTLSWNKNIEGIFFLSIFKREIWAFNTSISGIGANVIIVQNSELRQHTFSSKLLQCLPRRLCDSLFYLFWWPSEYCFYSKSFHVFPQGKTNSHGINWWAHHLRLAVAPACNSITARTLPVLCLLYTLSVMALLFSKINLTSLWDFVLLVCIFHL
jgi:hypothetical protein